MTKRTPRIILLVALGLVDAGSVEPPASAVTGTSYRTGFPATEDPISEHDHWINGKTVGLDWADVATIPGLAFGRESGSTGYDDSTALLTGDWRPDQTVQATVYTVNQTGKLYEEVELRLRGALSPHKATGYEILFRCLKAIVPHSCAWQKPSRHFLPVYAVLQRRLALSNVRRSCAC